MSRKVTLQLGNCDSCDRLIEGAVITFICKIHYVCFNCSQTMPGIISDWTRNQGSCPYCKLEGAAYIEKTESKQPFARKAPNALNLKKSIGLPYEPLCGWPTLYNNVIAVGRQNSATVDIVNITGQVISYKLPLGSQVTSGIYLDTTKCLLSVGNPDNVITCDICPKERTPSPPKILSTLAVLHPVCVFSIIKFKYGVLCMKPWRFEIFSKRAIYTDEIPKPANTLTINLPKSKRNLSNRACSTPDGHICVSSYINHKVYIYDDTGLLVTEVGEEGDLYSTVTGELYYPRYIESTEDGTLVITCNFGDIHTYRQGTGWKVVKRKDCVDTCAGVLSESWVWLIRYRNKSVDVYMIQS